MSGTGRGFGSAPLKKHKRWLPYQTTKMRDLNLVVTKQFLVLILSLSYLSSYGTSKVLIKANILRGERFVTARTSARDIEVKVSEVFEKKGFEIVTKMQSTGDILLVDFFVYQFPAQFPAVTITIRTQDGIHYIDQEFRKVFIDRELTNQNLAIELAERVPHEINKDEVYKVGIGNLISTNNASNSMLYTGNSNYYSTIKWKDDNNVPFILPSDLGLYLFYASNFTGLKNKLARGPILLKLRINDSARFEHVNANSLFNLDENQKNRIREFIDSFPLWLTDTEVEDIEIMYGLK